MLCWVLKWPWNGHFQGISRINHQKKHMGNVTNDYLTSWRKSCTCAIKNLQLKKSREKYTEIRKIILKWPWDSHYNYQRRQEECNLDDGS